MNEKLLMLKKDAEFENFYKENLPKVIRHVCHKVQDSDIAKDIAEDVAQEVFCLALAKWDEVKAKEIPLRWLFQAANYKLMEMGRKLSKHPMVYLEDSELEPSLEVMEFKMSELELSALETMREGDWDLLKKYYIEGFPIEELARSQGVTPNNMRVRLSRMRSKLKSELEK